MGQGLARNLMMDKDLTKKLQDKVRVFLLTFLFGSDGLLAPGIERNQTGIQKLQGKVRELLMTSLVGHGAF